ncbi:putative cellulose binding protein [Lasiosphaeria hispida]|uniref:Cellulose binding protein n=1 Tax=Lasiosphaeria hispida TaxID=260671 RepID=A0AAJ0HUX9_9PEZI|nr:putative cellulose binding protein [Lasiosphaeria hispida]
MMRFSALGPGLVSLVSLASAASLTQVTSFGANTTGAKMYIYVPDKLAASPPIISPYSGNCWDVSSTASLTHDGGTNSNSIANMVGWTISRYKADASRVFAKGTSSGAMMTNSIQTQAKWASTALNMYPGYTGPRPKMLIIHGSADTTIYPQNFNETLKQWAGVLGYTYGSPQQTLAGNPSSEYTKYVYGPDLVGVYGTGITHNVPINGAQDLEWLGITGADAPSSSSSSAIVCGGIGYAGCTTCASPYTCKVSNHGTFPASILYPIAFYI